MRVGVFDFHAFFLPRILSFSFVSLVFWCLFQCNALFSWILELLLLHVFIFNLYAYFPIMHLLSGHARSNKYTFVNIYIQIHACKMEVLVSILILIIRSTAYLALYIRVSMWCSHANVCVLVHMYDPILQLIQTPIR